MFNKFHTITYLYGINNIFLFLMTFSHKYFHKIATEISDHTMWFLLKRSDLRRQLACRTDSIDLVAIRSNSYRKLGELGERVKTLQYRAKLKMHF